MDRGKIVGQVTVLAADAGLDCLDFIHSFSLSSLSLDHTGYPQTTNATKNNKRY